jgi:CheY-like chemotaxis protein
MVPFHAGIRIEREGAVGLLKVLQDANDKAIRRVLIVEDDEAIASMFAALLKLLGYETQVVNRTGEAMRMIAKQLPHVIFLDSNLPDLPGTEVCRMLRNDMSTSSLPIFMISEDTSQENIESALSAGADMFLSKPVGLDELLRAMAKFVGGANPDKPYS